MTEVLTIRDFVAENEKTPLGGFNVNDYISVINAFFVEITPRFALSKRTCEGVNTVGCPLERASTSSEGKETAMLVLSRKKNQKIVIPSIGATIEVIEIKGNTVRLGIQAPKEVPVVREELAKRIANESNAEFEITCC